MEITIKIENKPNAFEEFLLNNMTLTMRNEKGEDIPLSIEDKTNIVMSAIKIKSVKYNKKVKK
jgi:hypothetical protein